MGMRALVEPGQAISGFCADVIFFAATARRPLDLKRVADGNWLRRSFADHLGQRPVLPEPRALLVAA
jgi:hypothetical protein